MVSNEFVMSINLDEIPPFILDFHFGSGYFIILESVDMPTFINDKHKPFNISTSLHSTFFHSRNTWQLSWPCIIIYLFLFS